MFMQNFSRAFGNTASVILTSVGIISGGVSMLPIPMPLWLNIALKAIGIAAPIAGAIVGTVKFFKDKKKNVAPQTATEMALLDDDERDELYDETLKTLYDDFDEARENVADNTRFGKDTKCTSNKKSNLTKGSSKNSKKTESVSKEVKTPYKFPVLTCKDIAKGNEFFKSFEEFKEVWNAAKEMPVM